MRELPDLPGIELTHRYEEAAPGLRLHVAEAGDPEAPPAVLLHGWPQHWWMWRHLIGPLTASGRRVLAIDLRGLGWSDAPAGGYDKAQLATDVLAVLDAMGVQRAAFVGHDWGAVATALIAMRAPERVEHAVVMSVPPPWAPRRPQALAALPGAPHVPFLASPIAGPRFAASRRFLSLIERLGTASPPWDDRDRELFFGQFAEPARARAAHLYYRTAVTTDLRSHGGRRPDVPITEIAGAREPMRAALGPDAIIVPGAAHFVAEEQPQRTNQLVLQALRT